MPGLFTSRSGYDLNKAESKKRDFSISDSNTLPKMNGHVERANRTHREEFYEVEKVDLSPEEHNRQLERWEYVYNYIRSHQSLDYLTLHEYYQLW